MTYDVVNRCGIIEPVGTHPSHWRRGLALAQLREGLRRLKSLGASDAYVDTGDGVAANELYNAAGFEEAYRGCIWQVAPAGELVRLASTAAIRGARSRPIALTVLQRLP